MLESEKRTLTAVLKRNENFKRIINKLTLSKQLTSKEKSFILSCALLILDEYNKDRRYKSYADLAYYIILKYSLTYSDFKPLYDFSIEFGFYPITNSIIQNELLETTTFNDIIVETKLELYERTEGVKSYIETLEQSLTREKFLEDSSFEKGFIAPTSFGKSSIIVQHIKSLKGDLKIAIIVPTKSLLHQTYKMIREADLEYKILLHDEMYQKHDKTFIAVFTQERALRLMSKHNIIFDTLIIDEAHNILKNDNRNLLLARLIRLNKIKNTKCKITYLSPLVDDINNLSINNLNKKITPHTINFNIKSPEFFEYTIDNNLLIHNTFFSNNDNQGLLVDSNYSNYFELIKNTSRDKNFIYNYRPIHIEDFAKKFKRELSLVNNFEIDNIISILSKEIHENFYCISLLRYGIIYLHGKLPDLVKEYLEEKFVQIRDIKYIVANSVILEGMNLPIDNLYILNTKSLKIKGLVNLIGRVNRLNEIFKKGNNLNKLLPPVYFVNNYEYNKRGEKAINMFNKIRELRDRDFKDEVLNPLLEKFDIKNIKEDTQKAKIKKTLEYEDFLIQDNKTEEELLKEYFIENSFDIFYKDLDILSKHILKKIKLSQDILEKSSQDILEKIYNLFIKDFIFSDDITDFELYRLKEEKARTFYRNHIKNRKLPLKDNIQWTFAYLKGRKESINKKDHIYYIGTAYGEIKYKSDQYFNELNNYNVAIDLSKKNDIELINYAIVKLKIEDEFISFKLNKFIIFLYDYQLITEDEYHNHIYGTTNKSKIELTKYGLSIGLIERLSNDNQINNGLSFDKNGNLTGNSTFKKYINTLNDFERFEINKYII